MAYTSNAYNLERAARNNTAPREQRERKAVIKKFPVASSRTKYNRSLIIYTVMGIAIALAVCFNIYMRTEINDTKNAIAKADKTINTLNSEKTRLNVEFEKVISYSTLEEQATALGMQKRSVAQVHYIDTSKDDYAEVIDK